MECPKPPTTVSRERLRYPGRWPRLVAVGVGVLLAFGATPSAAQDETTTTTAPAPETTAPAPTTTPPDTAPVTEPPATPSTLSAEDEARKAEAAGELNAAMAEDVEIASALTTINAEVQQAQSRVDEIQAQLETAWANQAAAGEQIAASAEEESVVEVELAEKAVNEFQRGLAAPPLLLSSGDVGLTMRQEYLYEETNDTAADRLEALRILRADSEAAEAAAAQAAVDAEALADELAVDLEALKAQQETQLALKGEAEARISRWESALSDYAAQDQAIQDLIAGAGGSDAPANLATAPSALGFQWPVDGTVTSEYGYRTHPVYGTQKLHSGMDISAPSGTPISAAAAGTVISVGVQGGYGNTVMVDHGGGVVTLYAHMSSFNTSEGATVARGDVIGGVGRTGTATGNHLHFEVRVGGSTTDPRPYLP